MRNLKARCRCSDTGPKASTRLAKSAISVSVWLYGTSHAYRPKTLELTITLWGKWGEFVEPLPLLGHMLDTAAFALDLWPQLSGPLRVNAADLLAAGDEELGSARFGVLAALHDLGKASREFQGQLWTRQHAQFAANTQALAATGLPMDAPPRPVLSGLDAAWLRHEAVTGLILKDRTGLPAWARRVVAGHHGRYQPAQSDVAFELDALHVRASDPAWAADRCRVTLLSATLPRARVAELCAAWTSGWHADDKPAVRDALSGALPPTLPYPSVVSVDDALGCEPLEAWRRFELELVCHRLPAGRTGMLTATAAVVARLRAEQPEARIGVLVNTVDRAIGVYQALASSEPGQTVLLHSRMTAAQRRQRTAQLHHLVGQHAAAGPVLVVATQVAEASLDLDLDLLVTDLAPMASLLQRTGRLWRHSVNTGHGWTHPPHLAYRTGNPTVHVLAPVDDEGRVATGAAALPYTTAELQATWSKPACLDGGARRAMSVPGDVQAAVDSAHLTLADLVDPARSGPAGRESAETQAVLAHLADQLAKSSAAQRVGMAAHEVGRWRPDAGQDPWGADSPDWSALTGPTLWDAEDGVVTRLQERDQATVLLCDPTGTTPWAWTGEPAALLRPRSSRATLLDALGATVPVSGALARRLRERAREHLPTAWAASAPVLLRSMLPLPVTALDGVAYLDPILGLIRQEQP